jgi:hypothetical protein
MTLKFAQKFELVLIICNFQLFSFFGFLKIQFLFNTLFFLFFLVHSLKDNRDSHRILIEGGKSFG